MCSLYLRISDLLSVFSALGFRWALWFNWTDFIFIGGACVLLLNSRGLQLGASHSSSFIYLQQLKETGDRIQSSASLQGGLAITYRHYLVH